MRMYTLEDWRFLLNTEDFSFQVEAPDFAQHFIVIGNTLELNRVATGNLTLRQQPMATRKGTERAKLIAVAATRIPLSQGILEISIEQAVPAGERVDGFDFRYGAHIKKGGELIESIGFGGSIEIPDEGLQAVRSEHVAASIIAPDKPSYFIEVSDG